MDLSPRRHKNREFVESPIQMSLEEEEDAHIFARIERHRKYETGIYQIIAHPFRFLTLKPDHILVASVPAALILFVYGFIAQLMTGGLASFLTSTFIDDIVVFSVLIAIVPLSFLDLKESSRVNSIENALPNFFRDVAGMRESGMTLPGAIHLISSSEYGALTPYIRKLDYQMSWNFQFIEAIKSMGNDLRNPLVERSVDLIARATEAGGDIVEVLRAAGRDSLEYISLKTDRKNNMIIYVVIILVAFAVFLFVIYVLVTAFLKTMV